MACIPILAGISSLKKVTIPESVTYMSSNVGAFENCKNLEEVIFVGTSKVTQMSRSFYGCSSLRKVNIPSSVTSLSQMFYGCKNLSVYYDGTLENWCAISDHDSDGLTYVERFYYKKENEYEELIDLVIPERVTTIDTYTFKGYKGLRSVKFHEGVTAIRSHAFENCTNITSLELPSQLKVLESDAFCNVGITSIIIPQYITEITDTFRYCGKLQNVVIHKNVEQISDYAFFYCNLKSVVFEDPKGWTVSRSSGVKLSSEDLNDPAIAAKYLGSTYCGYFWEKSKE